MKNKKIYLIMTMFLFSIMLLINVNAIQTSDSINGYIIEVPIIENYDTNENITFNAYVYNNSNGVRLLNSDVDCLINIYNDVGVNIIQDNMTKNLNLINHEYIYNFDDDGVYSVLIDCQNDNGGFLEYSINVNNKSDGQLNLNLLDTTTLIILGLMVLTILILIFFQQFIYSGSLTLILGLIFMFSSGNYLLSSFIILAGIGQLSTGK